MSLLLSLALLAQSWCGDDFRTTGYARSDYGPGARTFDGTSIFADEPLAAASWDIPLQSIVSIDGLGSFRVADRGGGLGSYRWVDIATWSRVEAFALTSPARAACVYPPGGAP